MWFFPSSTRRGAREAGGVVYSQDFYCPAEKLAVELDGASHDHESAQDHDARRDQFLSKLGIRTVRFENRDVRKNIEGVLAMIEQAFKV